jgi:hypothetical protein
MTPTDPFAPEREALAAVARGARAQLAALRDGAGDAFEAASSETLDAVALLDRRRQDRVRRVSAPGAPAAGPDARVALEAAAAEARRACDELEAALEQAVALGRDLLGAMHHATAPASSQTYTASGRLAPAGHARLHQTG